MSTAPDPRTHPGLIRPTWAEIDLDAFDRNVDAVVARLPEGSRLIAVLNADGYGHGAVTLARRLRPERVAMIATALLEEAHELREAGIQLPLLVLGSLSAEQIRQAADHDITVGIPGPEALLAAREVAAHRDVRVHLKLDSGMGRMGLTPADLAGVAEIVRDTPRLHVDAIYTHFAKADAVRDPFTNEQLSNFTRMVAALRTAGVEAPLQHSANSAATMRGLVQPGEHVRVGLTLYGAEPLEGATSVLEPVLRWRTSIVRLKELPPGHSIGYGGSFVTKRASRIATLPVGYADGYNRRLSNQGEVIIRGQRAPVVGRVSMDLVTIDVTEIPDAVAGDEVTLLGDGITVEELAAKLGTISYEVLCGIGPRVPRLYLEGETATLRSRFDR